MGRKRYFSSVVGDVSDAGGDRRDTAGVDDGSGNDVCVDLLGACGIFDAQSFSRSSADIDVYADDSDVCDDSGFAAAGVFADDE